MRYGVIGEKLGHSFSKEIHTHLADYEYEICEIPREDLKSFFEKRDFCAINVTIPYKKEVIPHLDVVSDIARELDSVNTIVNKNGTLYGYNTDYYGLKMLIERTGADLRGKKVLVLGTGGTSRTAHLVARHLGAKEVYLVSRQAKDGAIDYTDAQTYHSDADVIINATPCGMYPNNYASPLNLDKFPKACAIIDAIFNPLSSELVLDARAKGIIGEGGLYMLVAQAVFAVEFFLDTKIPKEKIESVFDKIYKSKENIVLIGMPCSGKSTVGKILADNLGRELFDLDTEIEKVIGTTISEYFAEHGESAFREVESEILKEISKKTGVIISTGGGAILKKENVRALRANGRIYFLDRALELLFPTDDRPLSRSRDDLTALFETRYPMYLAVADVRVDGDGSPQDVADLIRKDFSNEDTCN